LRLRAGADLDELIGDHAAAEIEMKSEEVSERVLPQVD